MAKKTLEQIYKENFNEVHFKFDDLKLSDLKDEVYYDAYHFLRRPIEPQRLQSIYQQAFIYDLLYNFAKEYLPHIEDVRKDVKANLDEENVKATDTTVDSIKEKVIEYLFKNQINLDKSIDKSKLNDNENKEDLWSIDDINILRKNFKEIKENNFYLKSKIATLEQENQRLREKFDNLKMETENMPNEIKTLEKENERLYIRVHDLETRYESYSHELTNVDKIIKKMSDEQAELKVLNQQLKSEKLKSDFEMKKCEHTFNSFKTDLNIKFTAKIEKCKFKFERQIHKLNEKLTDATNRYQHEKKSHEKTKQALEHLRNHFATSCVPMYNPRDKIDEKNIKII